MDFKVWGGGGEVGIAAVRVMVAVRRVLMERKKILWYCLLEY